MGLGHTGEFERFADDRMLDLIHRVDALEAGVFDDDLSFECPVLCDVDVFIDRGGDEKSSVFRLVGRQVRAAATERDPKR